MIEKKFEIKKCRYCGKTGLGQVYGSLKSDVKVWTCPNCGKQYQL